MLLSFLFLKKLLLVNQVSLVGSVGLSARSRVPLLLQHAQDVQCHVLEYAILFRSNRVHQGWKFMSCRHSQELGQQASWLVIGCTSVNNQSEARSAS